MRSAGPWLSSSRLFCGARRCWVGLFVLKRPWGCGSGADLMTRVTLDDWADAVAVFWAAPSRSRDWPRPDRQLPWRDEKRASAPFWQLRPASRPRRRASLSHVYVLPSWNYLCLATALSPWGGAYDDKIVIGQLRVCTRPLGPASARPLGGYMGRRGPICTRATGGWIMVLAEAVGPSSIDAASRATTRRRDRQHHSRNRSPARSHRGGCSELCGEGKSVPAKGSRTQTFGPIKCV